MAKVLGVLVPALVVWVLTETVAEAAGRWQQVENNPSCVAWNEFSQPNVTVTWSGACANGKAQGQGTKILRALIEGELWEHKYTGEMKDGKAHGRGDFVEAHGDRYEGDWKDGKMHGHGVFVGANGDRYEGDWKDGKLHGHGVFVGAGRNRYEGEWKDNKKHGRGTVTLANGDKCEGDWREGRLLGMGKGRENGQSMKCYMDENTIRFTD